MPTTTSSRPCSVNVSQPQGGAQFYGDAEAQALSEWEHEAHHDPDNLLEEPDAEQRWAMVLHNEYPSNRAQVALTPVGKLRDDDNVVLFVPRNRDVYRYIKGVKSGAALPPKHAPVAAEAREPVTPYPAVHVPTAFDQWPRIEALAVVKGEHVCTNDDLIRNTAYNWSPMTAAEISEKTGIEQRVYTERSLDDIAMQAAQEALQHVGRQPEETGAVLFCSSIPAAIADAVRDKVISQPTRIFAPGFGAGAVAGFAVMRIDPRVIATTPLETHEIATPTRPRGRRTAKPCRRMFG